MSFFSLGNLLIAGTALAAGGSIFSGLNAHKENKRAAAEVRKQADQQAALLRRDAQRIRGRQIADFAAAGVSLEGGGTAGALIEETDRLAAQDIAAIYEQGARQAQRYERDAKYSTIQGFINAGNSLFSGSAQYKHYKDMGLIK